MSNLPIEIWPIEAIKPYEKNAKKHPAAHVDKLAGSIKKFGWTQPLVVDADGVLIIGHGRRLAAIKLGLAKIPVVVRKDLTKAEADALRLADNRVTSTEYDMNLVKEELMALDPSLLEFTFMDEKELSFMTADLMEMPSEDVFVEDIQEAVEDQKAENNKKAAEIDASAAPLADAFGFKRLSVAQSRKVRIFMNEVEKETGKKGADALIAYIDELGYA